MAHRIAHTLKGVAGGIGALALAESAKAREKALKDGQKGSLDLLTGKLGRDLLEVVEDLQEKIPPRPSIGADIVSRLPIDWQKIKGLLDEVQVLVEEINPDAGRKAEEFSRLFQHYDTPHRELAARLARQAENLDFEEALATLAELREALKGNFTEQAQVIPGKIKGVNNG
jgi:HPt (histidine-containing phosphotransfer) domain-containing protein